jgi:hypothetical protein
VASEVVQPTKSTLRKYGLTVEEWQSILDSQGGACGACGRVPPSRRLNIDHQHVRGWKAMDPVIRATYVRGLLCYMCNSQRLARGATVENLRGAADYLERYQNK